ncbi:hypothetical protein ACIP5Y_24265 [Nocardia sp. NPDC088792]
MTSDSPNEPDRLGHRARRGANGNAGGQATRLRLMEAAEVLFAEH